MLGSLNCSDAELLVAPDSTTVALHDLGGTGSPLLFSHATGFHAHCYEPMAAALGGAHSCAGLDHRGHGDSSDVDTASIEWLAYGRDALVAARHLSARHGSAPLVGFGHSMGGATLLMAAHAEPGLFRALFLYEPIVFPPPHEDAPPRVSALPAGARKRRSSFGSFDSALANFASKPPLASFHPAAREAYVRHGFAARDDGSVTLKCAPEHEARTYETGGSSGMFSRLGGVRVPVWVLSGAVSAHQPSAFAEVIAAQIPGASFHRWEDLGHFGPFEHPERVASFLAGALASLEGMTG